MSDDGLADDLFGEDEDVPQPTVKSPGTATPPVDPPTPVASGSRPASRSPKPEVKAEGAEDDDEGLGDDLFGDDDDDDDKPPVRDRDDSSATPPSGPSTPGGDGEREGVDPLEYAEEDVEQPPDDVFAKFVMRTWKKLAPSDGRVWSLKLPTHVNVESRPYDPDLYRLTSSFDPDEVKDPSVAQTKMIGLRNTLRWKWVTGPDGEPMRQSNSRVLRWSDGSVSLQVGNEVYDMSPSHGSLGKRPNPSAVASGTTTAGTNTPYASGTATPAGPSHGAGVGQKLGATAAAAAAAAAAAGVPADETTYVCVPDRGSGILVTECAVTGSITLIPTSMTSGSHMEILKNIGKQHVKHSRMKILDDLEDQSLVQSLLQKAAGPSGPKSSGGKARSRRPPGSSGGRRSRPRAGSDESSDEGRRRYSGLPGAVRAKREEADYDDDDGFVVADSDEDEGGLGGEGEETDDDDDAEYGARRSKSSGGGKKGKKRRGGAEELDDLEEADRRIEAREREKKRAKKSKETIGSEEDAEGEEEDMDMDMDDE